jgi:hypothetical protein
VAGGEADADIFEPEEGFEDWAPILGRWELSDELARYMPPPESSDDPAIGMALSGTEFGAGLIHATVRFPAHPIERLPQGRIVIGYDTRREAHYSAGLGGWNALYTIEEFVPGRGYLPVRVLGSAENLQRERDYDLLVQVFGQTLFLEVDGVEVVEVGLPGPLPGNQIGLLGRGVAPVEFKSFSAAPSDPLAFVVMQFGEPYDTLYREVIRPVCIEQDYAPQRADDVYGPGIILSDIVRSIRRAAVVIAEITPVNANVFYELGYAHAVDTPTILLAESGHELPFDISSYRCIFYDDSIGGKRRVEADLRRHLAAISP